MIIPKEYMQEVRKDAENGDLFAIQIMGMIKAQAIGAAIALPFLFWLGYELLTL